MIFSSRLSVHSALATIGLMLLAGSARAVEPIAIPGGGTLDVMTINLEHHDEPAELKAMAADLKKLKKVPDFILCQEVYFQRHGTKADPETNTAAVFAKYLGYYCKGTKRTSDREGIAIISKYPFDHYESINLKSQTLRLLLGFRRISVMGEFTVPGIGKVRVADTHLTNWEFEGHVRSKQIAETLSWVEEREKVTPAKVNLFGGDFNAKSNWGEMTQILKSALNGGVAYQDHNGTEFTQGSHGDPSKRIDFIFVAAPKPLLQFVSEKILWKSGLFIGSDHFYPSDHLGVLHSYAVAAPPVVTPIAATSQEPTD